MPTQARTATRRATPASPATRRRSTMSRRLMRRCRIRRHDPEVQVLLLRLHGPPTFSEVSPTPHDFTLGQRLESRAEHRARRPPTVQPAGGIVIPPTPTPSSTSGCTATDFNGFVPGRIALIQRGSVQLRREGAQRPGRGRIRRDHLQRGQPRPHRRCSAAAWSTPTATRSSRRSRSRSRRSPPAATSQPVQQASAGRAAGHEPRHPGDRRPEPPTTTTSSRSPRAATRTTSWSSTRTSTRSTAPACSTTPPARRRSWTSPRR